MDANDAKSAQDGSGNSEPSRAERNWAMGCHLIGLCGVAVPFPAAGVIGTLVLWLLKREDGRFIDSQGRESLNFQISLLIYLSACLMLTVIKIGIFLFFPVIIFGFICIIMGAIKASEGTDFRYPACLRFIK